MSLRRRRGGAMAPLFYGTTEGKVKIGVFEVDANC